MGLGRQQKGPFQGVRVKNSVKELLLHIRSHKQKTSGQVVDDFKVTELFFLCGYGVREFSLSEGLFSVYRDPISLFVHHKIHRTENKFFSMAILYQSSV